MHQSSYLPPSVKLLLACASVTTLSACVAGPGYGEYPAQGYAPAYGRPAYAAPAYEAPRYEGPGPVILEQRDRGDRERFERERAEREQREREVRDRRPLSQPAERPRDDRRDERCREDPACRYR